MNRLPYIRKTGRYLFYGVCALGISAVVYVLLRGIGTGKDLARMAGDIAAFVAFIQLRDLDKYGATAIERLGDS